MNVRNCMTVTIVALATMGLVLAVSWPNPLGAEDPTPAKAAKVIKIPTLNTHGVTLSFVPRDAADTDDYIVRLKAVNTTDKPVSFDMTVAVNGLSLQSMMSRSPVVNLSKAGAGAIKPWSKTCPVSLSAGETTIITVETGRKATSFGDIVTPMVTVEGKQLHGGGFRAVTPAKRTPNGNVVINNGTVANLNGLALQAANNTQMQVVAIGQGR